MEPKAAARTMLASRQIDIISKPGDSYRIKKGTAIFFIANDKDRTMYMCDSADDIRSVFDREIPVREWRVLQLLEGISLMCDIMDRSKKEYLPEEIWIVKNKKAKILGGAKGESVLVFDTDELARKFIAAKRYDAVPEKINRAELFLLAQIYQRDIYRNSSPKRPMELDFFN